MDEERLRGSTQRAQVEQHLAYCHIRRTRCVWYRVGVGVVLCCIVLVLLLLLTTTSTTTSTSVDTTTVDTIAMCEFAQ